MKQRLLLISILCLPVLAMAQVLRDPTQPPASVVSPQAGMSDGLAGDLRLDGIRRQSGKSPLAVISGQLYKVGDQVAGRKLIRIGESEITLANGDEREVLRLAPAVDKIMKTNRSNRPAARGNAGSGA